jgi:hypothetical protein
MAKKYAGCQVGGMVMPVGKNSPDKSSDEVRHLVRQLPDHTVLTILECLSLGRGPRGCCGLDAGCGQRLGAGHMVTGPVSFMTFLSFDELR